MTIQSIIKKQKWFYLSSDITNENFPKPKEIKTEGYKIIKMEKSFTSQEALDRIKKEGCRPANIYELALLRENHPELWEDGKWTSMVAFGSEYVDSVGVHRVPFVFRYSDGVWRFNLGIFSEPWVGGLCLVCFCDNQSSDTQTPKKELETLTLGNATFKDWNEVGETLISLGNKLKNL